MSDIISIENYFNKLRQARLKALDDRIDVVDRYLAEEDGKDKIALGLKALYEICKEVEQTEPVNFIPFLETKKVCRIHSGMSQKSLQAIYNEAPVLKIPNVGVFVVVDGIQTSHGYKVSCGYDEWESDIQKLIVPVSVPSAIRINFASIPSGYRIDLVSLAIDGLFFPKDTPFVSLFRRHQLEFFDINDYCIDKNVVSNVKDRLLAIEKKQ